MCLYQNFFYLFRSQFSFPYSEQCTSEKQTQRHCILSQFSNSIFQTIIPIISPKARKVTVVLC